MAIDRKVLRKQYASTENIEVLKHHVFIENFIDSSLRLSMLE